MISFVDFDLFCLQEFVTMRFKTRTVKGTGSTDFETN